MVDGWTKMKLGLNSTQVKVVVEVGVELGNSRKQFQTFFAGGWWVGV